MKEETKKAIIAEILDFARVISEKKVEYSLNDLQRHSHFIHFSFRTMHCLRLSCKGA